jgi:hypothetical protein
VTVVAKLLEDRRFPHDRAEDVRQADRFFQKITDPVARSQLSTALRIAKLYVLFDREHDPHVFEELMTLLRDATDRNKLLFSAARARLGGEKFYAIEPLLKRLEPSTWRDSHLAEFLVLLALRQLQAGLVADARMTAQRVLPLRVPDGLDIRAQIAVAKAILGDIKPALAIAKKGPEVTWGIPYPTWVGTLNLVDYYQSGFELIGIPEFTVGAVTFTLAMNGKVDEALRTAQQFKGGARNPVAYTNIVLALLLKGNSTKALEILKTLRVTNNHKIDAQSQAHLQAQAVSVFVLDRIKKGDLKGGEQAIQFLPSYETWNQISGESWQRGAQYHAELLLRLAEGAHRNRNAGAGQKYVSDAKKLIADARSNVTLQRTKPSTSAA